MGRGTAASWVGNSSRRAPFVPRRVGHRRYGAAAARRSGTNDKHQRNLATRQLRLARMITERLPGLDDAAASELVSSP